MMNLLNCVACPFHGPFSEAVTHHLATGHALTFRGVVQDFSEYHDHAKTAQLNESIFRYRNARAERETR